MSFASIGKEKRLSRLFDQRTKRTVITPIDDSLIFGPYDGLTNISSKIEQIAEAAPNAILTYQGLVRQKHQLFLSIGTIINLTASTSRIQHTNKVIISNVLEAVRLDADAVAVHVNITSQYESNMLVNLGKIISESQPLGIPVLAIMYPRKEVDGFDDNYEKLLLSNPNEYTKLVSHAVRIAADLGADIIKTKYTGSPETFLRVVEACKPVPVVIAGGPLLPFKDMLEIASGAMKGGAAGVSFGRNIFNRQDSRNTINALKKIVFEDVLPADIKEE